MKFIILSSVWTAALALLHTVDVGPIVDIDLTLYKLTYDKDKGQILRDFPDKDGFSATKVEMRGMETAERKGQAFIAVDGPLYKMAYTLEIPKLQFLFGHLKLPTGEDHTNAIMTSTSGKMERFLEYTPLKNGKCLISDGVIWSDIGNGVLEVAGQPNKDVSLFFNTTFRDALNSRSAYTIEYDSERCKEFTTPFTTIFV